MAIKNIIIKRLNKKLDYKYIELYKIIKKILKNNYELNLLLKVRIYLIFYISLLNNAKNANLVKTGRDDVKINRKDIKTPKTYRNPLTT